MSSPNSSAKVTSKSRAIDPRGYPERCASFVQGVNGEADVHMWSSIHGDWTRIELSEPGLPVDSDAPEYGSAEFREAIALTYEGVASPQQLLGRLAEMSTFTEA